MRARRAASVVLAAAILVGTAGCNFITPPATLLEYDPSDGVGANVGEVNVRNMLLVTVDGSRANLAMTVINRGGSGEQITFQYENASGERVDEQLFVNGGASESLGRPDEEQLFLDDIDATPGDLFPVYVQYGDEQGVEVLVPVLDDALPEYADLLPPEQTSTPSPVDGEENGDETPGTTGGDEGQNTQDDNSESGVEESGQGD